jgi:hypothetical protein
MQTKRATETSIEPVRSKHSLKLFLETPLLLHRNDPFWVPLPMFMEKDQLAPQRNPFWKHAEHGLFVALRDKRPVGRIAAVIDHHLDAAAGQRVGIWGYFACEDNADTAAALFQAVEDWHSARPEGKAAFLRGPLNPSLNYTAGMLVEGFEHFPPFMNPWNPPYYPPLAEACGMEKEQDLFFFRFILADHLAVCHQELNKEFTKKTQFSLRRSTRATYADDMRLLADLYTRCWSDNWGFTPLSAEEITYSWTLMRYLPIVSELIFLERQGEPVGMILFGADLSRALKRLNGRFSLSAPWQVIKGLGEVEGTRMFMFGLDNKYRRGIATFQLLYGAINICADIGGIKYMDAGWTLEDNVNINRICERLQGKKITRSRMYRRMCPYA